FFYRFHVFESCYRAEKMFPDHVDRAFGSYTCFYTHENVEGFFDDLPAKLDATTLAQAKKCMRDFLERLGKPGRGAIRRAAIDTNEFHAILVILFWFTGTRKLRICATLKE
ncbi:hypothetical protein PFISCL1PPCAC_9144, partial [Pristionchus fissidentatus]